MSKVQLTDTQKEQERLLKRLGGKKTPGANEFKDLIIHLDNPRILAKVFLLEGTPHVFDKSPMRYIIFKEQVADQFDVGSQDVCIVGSAKLGFSPSFYKYGQAFAEKSDVDVVIISEPIFYRGSRELFRELNQLKPSSHDIRPFLNTQTAKASSARAPQIALKDWDRVKQAIRNFVYQNFNPGLLSNSCPFRNDIFEKIGSTSGLFLALEPRVFVSKIRCRFFRTWKAAEDYYTNSLREVKNAFAGHPEVEPEFDDDNEMPEEADAESK